MTKTESEDSIAEQNNISLDDSHNGFDIMSRRNGGMEDRGNGGMEDRGNEGKEDRGNDCSVQQLCHLQKKVLCYQHRLAQLEEEVKTLCVDKELLLSRNQSLTAELHKKETATCRPIAYLSLNRGGQGQSAPPWLLADTSEYEVMMM